MVCVSEDERDPSRVSTRENPLRAMRWLVDGSDSSDSPVFHFPQLRPGNLHQRLQR
jgi:hypothetical protein